ncbi:MAG: hypothetical protein Q4B68_08805 [Bacteroidales bacterium]|nr:hypothetical protein [Bacteroidales bacterium]
MKNFVLILLVLSCIGFASCNDNEMIDGKVTIFEWADTSYPTQTIEKIQFYKVPQSGGEYKFVCTNKSGFLLRNTYNSTSPSMRELVPCTYAGVVIKNNEVYVTIAPNDKETHYCWVDLWAGNDHGSLYFVQEGVEK